MSEERQPIKRSEELAPLSREHHEGLLFVWKIRQGLQKSVDPKLIAQYVQWFWTDHLEEHFRREEQVLAPYLPVNEPMVNRMNEEHQEIEALVHINESIADAALLEQLANLINDHIRFEERELFPFAEKHIEPASLARIKEELDKPIEKGGGKWTEEFWLRK